MVDDEVVNNLRTQMNLGALSSASSPLGEPRDGCRFAPSRSRSESSQTAGSGYEPVCRAFVIAAVRSGEVSAPVVLRSSTLAGATA